MQYSDYYFNNACSMKCNCAVCSYYIQLINTVTWYLINNAYRLTVSNSLKTEILAPMLGLNGVDLCVYLDSK